MAKKGSMDDEALNIQRCAREIEKLNDPAAQARVALYLYLRYTAAGDRIAPGGASPPMLGAPSATERPVSGPAAPADAPTPPADSTPADGPADPQTGWDLSREGSENDDDEGDVTPEPNAELEDDEGEVEI